MAVLQGSGNGVQAEEQEIPSLTKPPHTNMKIIVASTDRAWLQGCIADGEIWIGSIPCKRENRIKILFPPKKANLIIKEEHSEIIVKTKGDYSMVLLTRPGAVSKKNQRQTQWADAERGICKIKGKFFFNPNGGRKYLIK